MTKVYVVTFHQVETEDVGCLGVFKHRRGAIEAITENVNVHLQENEDDDDEDEGAPDDEEWQCSKADRDKWRMPSTRMIIIDTLDLDRTVYVAEEMDLNE